MKKLNNVKIVEWILRVGVAGEFFGHGMLAIMGKKEWIAWIMHLLPVDSITASLILFAVGIFDVVAACIVLVRPVHPLLLWMAAWGFFTALLRPIMGIGWLDFIERWANWAAPLALYYLAKCQCSERKR